MLSKPLTIFMAISTMLFAVSHCFLGEAKAQSEVSQLITLPVEEFAPNTFHVYGRAPTEKEAGIMEHVVYNQTIETFPNLELFFEFGGTLELVTSLLFLTKGDIVISEIMWGIDRFHPSRDPTYAQWIELYNTNSNAYITTQLFLLFTPFQNHFDRDIIELPNGQPALVLDAVSNLHLGRWDLPGRRGGRPFLNVVSAYRDITYPDGENGRQSQVIVPFGSYNQSWKATPEIGRRNTLTSITEDNGRTVEIPYIATPGRQHVPDSFIRPVPTTPVRSNRVIINEVRNDLSPDNLDWVELKNVSRSTVPLENWELSIVTGVGEDIDLVNLQRYAMAPGEILLLQSRHPRFTTLADGINILNPERPQTKGATHKYFVAPDLNLPDTGKFVLLLRSESEKNGQDEAIEDYAGNGFFVHNTDDFSTEFWPRRGQPHPTDIADFGNFSSFGSVGSAWVRVRYNTGTGHHKDAWERIGTQGGIGYVPRADRSVSPGTPGYENDALRTRIDDRDFRTPITSREYNTGEITISEIMSDRGSRQNKAQWIELYNSSLTQAVNLEGWELEIRNLKGDAFSYVNGRLILNAAVILPNQTLLLVSKNAPNNVPANRIYNLYNQHRDQFRQSNRPVLLLNPAGFSLKLTDIGNLRQSSDDIVVDEAGNVSIEAREPTRLWDLPVPDPSARLSLVRQYGAPFIQTQRDRVPDPAAAGTLSTAWRQADRAYVSAVYYGDTGDRGTPGYRLGGPLPVHLSSFCPERTETGVIIVKWSTESELNNAGFTLLRSETRTGEFQVINPTLIIGAGTTSERQSYDFTDTTAAPNVVYYYRIEDVSFDGVRRTLTTVRLKGEMSASGKLTTTWSEIKRR